jgi:hypothetical protein
MHSFSTNQRRHEVRPGIKIARGRILKRLKNEADTDRRDAAIKAE